LAVSELYIFVIYICLAYRPRTFADRRG